MSKNIYSVSQVNTYIERMFADDYMLSGIAVSGEVSNCKYNHTGHIYFTLKDEKSAISCVLFAGSRRSGLSFDMHDGDLVVVEGKATVYSPAGRYQIVARQIKRAGLGDLHQRFEELKKELAESGMFDDMYKKPIPSFATRIGIITAPTGAAVHDIISVSKSRNPYVSLILFPAQVQGEGAVASIISGINTLDALGLDVIILGRGGGSIEDLWAFNEEAVARAIFSCNTPVISAVGHETDFTIADFVADKRAATPSQAAEIANFVYKDFAESLSRYYEKLNTTLDYKLDTLDERVRNLLLRIHALRPDKKLFQQMIQIGNYKKQLLAAISRRLDVNQAGIPTYKVRLDGIMNKQLSASEHRLASLSGRLEGLSPAKKLAAGFGYVTTSGQAVDSIEQLQQGDKLHIRFKDGSVESQITSIHKDE